MYTCHHLKKLCYFEINLNHISQSLLSKINCCAQRKFSSVPNQRPIIQNVLCNCSKSNCAIFSAFFCAIFMAYNSDLQSSVKSASGHQFNHHIVIHQFCHWYRVIIKCKKNAELYHDSKRVKKKTAVST